MVNQEIYNKMMERNVSILLQSSNTFASWMDDKRCVALVARGTWTINQHVFVKLLRSLDECATESFVRPILHHTFLMIKPWKEGNYTKQDVNIAEISRKLKQCGVSKYAIKFDSLIPVTTGLVMVGCPDQDINKWRDDVRSRGDMQEAYYLDIAHASILRWTRRLSGSELDAFLRIIDRFNKEYTMFAQLEVNSLDVVNASWLLRETDVEVFGNIKL
jgi:hypothetical protein